jgi:3D (Asp-Asp-Asp) domain-containing protein
LTLAVIFLYNGVVTLIEENKQLKVENTKIQRDSIQLDKQVDNLKNITEQQRKDTELLKKQQEKNINSLKEQIKESQDTNRKLKDELNKEREKVKTLSQVPSRGQVSGKKSFYVEASAYTALCNEGCTGITATGINLKDNRNAKVIAVDPRIIPLGTKVYVEGYGYAVAGDTGGAIKGYKVDLHVPTTQKAMQWGRKTVKLTILN